MRTSPTSRVLAAFACLTAATGCPQWERPRCEQPGVHSCHNNQPHFCAPSRELTPTGDEPCSAQGRVCAVAPDGVAHCAPVSR